MFQENPSTIYVAFFPFFVKITFFFSVQISAVIAEFLVIFFLLFLRGAFPYFYGTLPNLFEISIRLDIFKVLHMSATQVSLLKTEEENSLKITSFGCSQQDLTQQ